MLQQLLGRASEIADLEAAAELGIKKDKLLPEIKETIAMFKAGDMTKRKFMVKHVKPMLIVVFGCNSKKNASNNGFGQYKID